MFILINLKLRIKNFKIIKKKIYKNYKFKIIKGVVIPMQWYSVDVVSTISGSYPESQVQLWELSALFSVHVAAVSQLTVHSQTPVAEFRVWPVAHGTKLMYIVDILTFIFL